MNKIIYILLFFALTISLSGQSKSKDVLLFEIEKSSNQGGPRRLSSSNTFYFYQSGRIACKSLTYIPSGKEFRGNRAKCLKISQTKIKELTELAGKSDFQTESYLYFLGGKDWGKHFSIKYFSKSGDKEISLTSLSPAKQNENPAKIPPSLEIFLTKLGEIDETLKFEYEVGKK